MIKRVAVAIIYGPENLVLMGQRHDNNLWTFPAGHCEEGEDPHSACIREVKEETGLTVENAKLVMAGQTKENINIFVFVCKTSGNLSTKNDPDEEFQNLTYEDPFDRIGELHVPAHKNWALKYLANK
jgi:8-oxo-dGTP pyrophosphatase MutT (NUDIX family)